MFRIKDRLSNFSTPIIIGLIAAYLWFRPPAWISEEAKQPSTFAVQLIDGRTVSSDSLRGKVVLVNFWATWCPFCRHEMPAMDEFYRDHSNQGFEILALSVEDDVAAVKQFITTEKYAFPVAMNNSSVVNAFGNVSTVPISFLVDKQGVIRKKIVGQVHLGNLKDLVIPLLQE